MLQVTSRKSFMDIPLESGLLSTLPIGNYTVSQFALNKASLPSIKSLLLSHAKGLIPNRLNYFREQFESIIDETDLAPYTSTFISDGSLAVFRKASNFILYPLFHIELCHRTVAQMQLGIDTEYLLRLGPLEPILSFRSDPRPHETSSSSPKVCMAGYSALSKHALLAPLYFSPVVSLELFATRPGTGISRPISAHKILIPDFIAQAERTYVTPVSSTAEIRITYCGQHTLDHLCNISRIPLTFPASLHADTLPIFGHRGCGSNRVHSGRKVPILENTPFSILTARRLACVGSELDVILTKDKVPVINHDFELEVIIDTNGQSKLNLPIPCMTYNEIVNLENSRGIRVAHQKYSLLHSKNLHGRSASTPVMRCHGECIDSSIDHKAKRFHYDEITDEASDLCASCPEEGKVSYPIVTEKKRVFTLTEVLSQCTDMILNIELKYPSKSSPYSTLYPSRLTLVQTVLDALHKETQTNDSETSRIFISSFDPIICILVKLIAPYIPVFLLFMGDNTTITPYMDVDLTASSQLFSEDAVSVARSFNLTGLVLWKDILDVQTGNMRLHEYARHYGLTILTYGTAIGEDTRYQRDKGVSALICDLCHHKGHICSP